MVYPSLPREIHAPKRGEYMIFRETAEDNGGSVLIFDHYMQPQSGYSPEHIHIQQKEVYEIKQGTAVYVVDGVEKTAIAGEIITIPPNTYHVNPWNRDGNQELIIHRKTYPEDGAQLFFVTWFTLINAGIHITNKGYNMNRLQIGLIGASIAGKTYVKGMPLFIQRVVIPLIALIARLRGYKTRYPELEEKYPSQRL